jgi:hypothetical protein
MSSVENFIVTVEISRVMYQHLTRLRYNGIIMTILYTMIASSANPLLRGKRSPVTKRVGGDSRGVTKHWAPLVASSTLRSTMTGKRSWRRGRFERLAAVSLPRRWLLPVSRSFLTIRNTAPACLDPPSGNNMQQRTYRAAQVLWPQTSRREGMPSPRSGRDAFGSARFPASQRQKPRWPDAKMVSSASATRPACRPAFWGWLFSEESIHGWRISTYAVVCSTHNVADESQEHVTINRRTP